MYFYLYLFSDLFSRSIVGWEIWPEQTAEHSCELYLVNQYLHQYILVYVIKAAYYVSVQYVFTGILVIAT